MMMMTCPKIIMGIYVVTPESFCPMSYKIKKRDRTMYCWGDDVSKQDQSC